MRNTNSSWLVPFKGRNHSGATKQNFLWKEGNVYIMDNHRAALWCWIQEIALTNRVNLLHIDEHYDALCSQIDEWKASLPELRDISIEDYLALEYDSELGTVPVIRWDNYLSLFLNCFPEQVGKLILATHEVGDKPLAPHAMYPRHWCLPNNIEHWLSDGNDHWLVNVDLDYFFCDQDNQRKLMFSDDYISAVFGAIRRCREAGRIACITLCLTPDEEYTGGWPQVEELCTRACAILGVDFELPKE